MIKSLFAVIFLLFVTAFNIPAAQASVEGIKIYSGFLHQTTIHKRPFWDVFFSKDFPKQDAADQDRSCAIEFRSPYLYSDQPVAQVPGSLTYVVKFKGEPAFKKFFIKIFSNDDQEYIIDPATEGKTIGLGGEHHLTDDHLIFLILSHDEISHMELISAEGNTNDKYVLDQLEIRP